ncbi:MAG: NAD-dependent epimerase/dehydratase family protein [Acidobacteria bacterium]|nr:NAD-dependent epimerase/dehydratase family protein [Acidobacteriota bacterium]MBU4306492.1 NAD-dependent epimerase/dehydratase family protein [Acidobacteriota bacterium]MBU4404319.1 NAD-dependent epimerase/dehydratase family protein [Acidobacteriota bacterium]MCG2812423.1 NAD-dependent epimerase/dehydratase family protein [Candidatus Aminicenantes bacterium]
MKALVTGSSGFIGGHLVRHLLERGYAVSCLVRPASEPRALAGLAVTRISGSYFDLDTLRRAVEGMEYIFHAGAVLSAPDWPGYFRTNVEGTTNILEACAQANPGLRKLVVVSSISAVGPALDKKPLREGDDCRPVSLYGKSKYLAEQAAIAFFDRLPIVIVRPANVLGAGQRELLAVMNLLRRRIVPLISRGEKQTSICFVQDLVRALVLVAENESVRGRTYFVAAKEFYSWREILNQLLLEMNLKFVLKIPHPLMLSVAFVSEAISRLTGNAPLVTRSDLRSARNNYWLCDTSLIREELGFRIEVEFGQGIRDIVRQFKALRSLRR